MPPSQQPSVVQLQPNVLNLSQQATHPQQQPQHPQQHIPQQPQHLHHSQQPPKQHLNLPQNYGTPLQGGVVQGTAGTHQQVTPQQVVQQVNG